MNSETDNLDNHLREQLEQALTAVPAPAHESLATIRKRVGGRTRRAVVGVVGLASAAVLATTVTLLSGSSSAFPIVSTTSSLPAEHRSPLPFAAVTTRGEHFRLSAYRGKWVVVAVVTPQSCLRCVATEQGVASFVGQDDVRSRTVAVLVNEGPGSLPPTLPALSAGEWTVIDDADHHVARAFGVTALPYTVVIDPSGAVAGRVVGGANSGILNFIVAPSLLAPLVQTTVGNCKLTISVSPVPEHPGKDLGLEGYIFICPNSRNPSGIHDQTLTRPVGLPLQMSSGSGDNDNVSRQFFVTDRRIILVRLVNTTTGETLESMSTAWDDQIGFGIAALVVPASTDQYHLQVQGLDVTGAIVETTSWPPGGPSSFPR